MKTTEFVIMSKESPTKFLQHIGHSHTWGNRSDAMIYTIPQVASDLATKYGGIVVPSN